MKIIAASCALFAFAISMPAVACELADSAAAIRLARPVDGLLTSGFGMRTHPLLMVKKMHTGTDWGADIGTPVRASAGGEVISAGTAGEYGKRIVLRHGSGVETAYAHLSRIDVKEGDCVEQGAVIGGVGTTGLSTGPKLHFEVLHSGRFLDPVVVLADGLR